ncbi:DUF397 domain-containing protein [Embleya sp. NPDC005575]|uniref:DUF397 domain-containing protein n=1 Tax=Embleya sp. NPDC005575 TaxID=3156892 RepID=UPI0033A6CC8B
MVKISTNSTSVYWRTSTYSSGNGSSQCVEAANKEGYAFVRDSKVRSGPMHLFDASAWTSLLEALKR